MILPIPALPPRVLKAGLGLALFWLIALSAGLGGHTAARAAGALPYGEGVLWQVQAAGQEPSFIFGTIHVADKRVIHLPAPVRDTFAMARSATFELIVSPEMQVSMGQASLLTDGRQLDQILGPELFEKAVATAGEYGLPAQAIPMLKPWALVPIFTFPPHQFALIAGGNAPLDEMLQGEAARLGKKVYALETAEEQLGLFENMPESQQVSMLRSLLRDVAATRSQFETMILSYLERDIAAIFKVMVEQAALEEDQAAAEAFQEDFVVARNKRMVERLRDILAEGNSFVAVGALHLPGEEGILALLAAKGYEIKRIY